MRFVDTRFHFGVLLLLLGILVVQCLILKEVHEARPPTLGEFREAQGDALKELVRRTPVMAN